MSAAASTTQANQIAIAYQDSTVINEDNLQSKAEANIQNAEISLNECGYTYCSIANSNSSVEKIWESNALGDKVGHEGNERETLEEILSWNEAQKSLEDNKLYWLNNEYLKSCMDDVSFVLSGSDITIAKYMTQTSKAEVYVFTISEENDVSFEFGRNYTSELYNIRQIKKGYTWQCFDYSGYDGTEYTSAVLADKNIVCEIKFENCNEKFICDTLASYN